MSPFRHLLSSKTPFQWSADLDRAFRENKSKIVELVDKGVKSFDPYKVTCLSPDWSQSGIGWLLQQKECSCPKISPTCCNSGWSLVLAGGRFCSPAAGRYSPTEGEGLAVAVALEQSKFYTLGCEQLYIATDHKPLVGIMNQQNLNTTENPRPQRIKERTMWWKFELIYTPGDSQKGADVISRSKSPVTLNNHDKSPDNE